MASAFLASANSLFARSRIQSDYNISPGEGISVGNLWTVKNATHATNGKAVSVWQYERSITSSKRGLAARNELIVECLKREAQALARMRHPCLLGTLLGYCGKCQQLS